MMAVGISAPYCVLGRLGWGILRPRKAGIDGGGAFQYAAMLMRWDQDRQEREEAYEISKNPPEEQSKNPSAITF